MNHHMTPSFISRNTLDFNVRNMVFLGRPDIQIELDESDSYIKSYSTLDCITGNVTITSRVDTRFDELEITLVGIAKTYIDKLGATSTISGRSESIHRFLRLRQPIDDSELPQPRIIEAGKTYRFPFTFVVPPQLLPRACSHKSSNSQVHEAHLQLPPSMGDPDLSGFGALLLDDLAPEMARISYAIKGQLIRTKANGKPNILAEGTKKLRIKPATEELPPLSIEGREDEYCLRKEKTLRKGLFKGKLGTLVMEASQPKSFCLPALAPGAEIPSVSTHARVKLRFDPRNENSPPPRLNSLASRLKVSTYFSTTPRRDFPKKANVLMEMNMGVLSNTMPLSSLCIGNVEWKRNDASSRNTPSVEDDRRFSTMSAMSTLSARTGSSSFCDGRNAIPTPSEGHNPSSTFYTATIIVPLSLPTSKTLIPTFHSCLISRVYSLHLALSFDGHRFTSSLALKVPVQISAEGSVRGVERRRQSRLEQQAILEADEAFEPRIVGPVWESSTPRRGAPPGYEVPGFSVQTFRADETGVRNVAVFG
jgi:hypothetical protein